MYTLRFTHSPASSDRHRVEIALENGEKDGKPATAVSEFALALSSQDQEDLRWYLEDYLQYPLSPAPTIAHRIETRIAGIGTELFRGLFPENSDAHKLFYQQALELLPSTAIGDLAVSHSQLGVIYRSGGNLDRALEHYQKSIRYKESAGNTYGAALTRSNIAVALAERSRFADAKEYALAALRNYQTYGAGAAEDVQNTLGLIADIDQAAKAAGASIPSTEE